MLLYLARHAQTASSAVDSFNGRGELPLTEHGREQARKLGQRLAGVPFAALYRSPLGRTAETAALIAPQIAAQVAERALAAVEQIRSRHPGGDERVLAVSHKATLRILAAALTGAPVATYRTRWSQDECALNLLELRAGKDPFLRLWNDTAHLGPDPGATTRGGKP